MVGGGFFRRPGLRRCLMLALVVGIAVLFVEHGAWASRAVPPRVLAGTAAGGDPWRLYLAGEDICPGGNRVDLPTSRKIATVACLINFARSQRGLRRLDVHASLSNASAAKAVAILRCRRFAHNPCGGDWTSSARASGFRGPIGENLYLGTGRSGAPRAVVDAWLNSTPHRRTLFGQSWKEQGLAVVAGEQFDGYRDVSLWVSVLGA